MAPKKKPKELKRCNNITVKLTDIELELLNQKLKWPELLKPDI